MNKCIVVPSVTYAQKGLAVLRDAGLYATTQKKRGLSRHGCAWCVTVRPPDEKAALALFSSRGVLTTGEVYDV